ncbi:MAG: hypothetical protein LUC91_05305, partial [Prevotella sp.]|nr:hypothetical protein [Prevotella sp.]
MRIKLITFAPHPNFGTCLQSYALNHVLRKLGHDVEFIYNGRETKPRTIIQRLKKLVRHFLPESIIYKYKKRHSLSATNRLIKRPPVILELPDYRLLYLLSRLPGYEKLYKAY